MSEVIGEHLSVHVEPHPKDEDACGKCGADSSHYAKHPTLIGGRCTACGGIWLPGMTFGPPEPIYAHQLRVEPTADGGALIHFEDL